MITLNDVVITQNHFPDGSLMMLDFPISEVVGDNRVVWFYENDSELFTLYCVVRHIRNKRPDAKISLSLPYIPHARMDRTKEDSEVFTLKYFAEFINSLNFSTVTVLDPHSNVSTALLNNVRVESVEPYIKEAIDDIEGVGIDGGEKYGGSAVIFFPDEGAMKRYKDLKVFGDRPMVYGKKERDWATGRIKGLKICDRDGVELTSLKEYARNGFITVLMIDDIVSYGGTLAYSGAKLKELSATEVYAYATHTENSVLDKERGTLLKKLDDGTVGEVYTSDSIYTGTDSRITIVLKKRTDE